MTRAPSVSVSAALRAALAAPLLAALACGGAGPALGGDAAAPVEGGGEAGGTVPTSCELASQAGCAADQQCSLFCDAQQLVVACRPEPVGAPAIGVPCSNLPCERGSACMATAGMAAATCKKLCAVTADCAPGQGCRVVTVTYACAVTGPSTVRVMVCL